MRDQGRVLQPDRRVLDRFPNEGITRGGSSASCRRVPLTHRDDRAFGQGQSVSVSEVYECVVGQWFTRIDGPGRSMRRQRRDGVSRRMFSTGSGGRPATNSAWRSWSGREDVPPHPSATPTRPTRSDRVRDNRPARARGLKHQTRESTELGAVPSGTERPSPAGPGTTCEFGARSGQRGLSIGLVGVERAPR